MVAALAVLPLLVGVAAAQPVVVRHHSSKHLDAQVFLVFDTSALDVGEKRGRSDSAASRAIDEADGMLPSADIPVGIATMTDRVLPNLMPTPDCRARPTHAPAVSGYRPAAADPLLPWPGDHASGAPPDRELQSLQPGRATSHPRRVHRRRGVAGAGRGQDGAGPRDAGSAVLRARVVARRARLQEGPARSPLRA